MSTATISSRRTLQRSGLIAELVEQRGDLDTALLGAIRDARNADRSWSEIGAMLGHSKQAAQRKYAPKISA